MNPIFAVLIGLLTSLVEAGFPFPQSQFLLDRDGFVLNFDGRTRNACWVYEKLTAESLKEEKGEHSDYCFSQDFSIPEPFRAKNKDFRDSGFDRGHLCPCADLPERCAKDSFLLSNISPQDPSLNRGLWKKLEKHIRKLTLMFKTLHVITLPLYLPEKNEQGQRYVHYEVIGENNIAVPTHFAKVIFAEFGETVEVFAYLLPNKSNDQEFFLEDFKTTLEKIERLSGILFHLEGVLTTTERVE